MSITDYDFDEVEIPQGTFIGWGKIGQTITVKVLSYAVEGGTDFNGNTCPQLVGELTVGCDNYKDKGATHETIDAGELVTVTCGLANLKKGITAAQPVPGDVVRMAYESDYKTASGTGKTIKVAIARGAGKAPSGPSPAEEGQDPF